LGAAALALVTLLGSADTVHGQTFNPVITACLDDHATEDPNPFVKGDVEECDGDNSPGGLSDLTVQFDVPAGDLNFGALINFFPGEFEITPGDEIPIGAVVGELTALATLGVIGAQCDNPIQVHFTMLNASIDITDTVPFQDTDDNGTQDAFEDTDESGLQDSVERYPEFISHIIGDVQPIRRAAGIQIVAGADVLLQFLVFEPGTLLIREIPSDEELGYPTVVFLQDIGDPDRDPEPNPITDFCTPLISSNIAFAISKDNPCTDSIDPDLLDPLCEATSAPLEIPDEPTSDPDDSGVVLGRLPPEAGTYTFTVSGMSQRDADGDSFENALDTCPYIENMGNPRIKGDGDLDEDGLDAACDPNSDPLNDGINSDEDADGYLNRGDNCPLIANGEEGENQKDSDVNEQGDPRPDGIGDACDENPLVPDGDNILITSTSELIVGGEPPDETPTDGQTPAPTEDDDGGGGAAIIIVIVVVVAVVVVGGGAFFLLRGRGA
jgi:hypothetical protein